MSVLVRKISRSKWGTVAADPVPADGPTNDLRTRGNVLSLWRCSTDDKVDVEQVVLALALSPAANRFDKIDVVSIPESSLYAAGIELTNTDGNTNVPSLVGTHVDAVNLTLDKVVKLATLIAERLKVQQGQHTFTKGSVKRLVAQAIEDGLVPDSAVEALPQDMKKSLNK